MQRSQRKQGEADTRPPHIRGEYPAEPNGANGAKPEADGAKTEADGACDPHESLNGMGTTQAPPHVTQPSPYIMWHDPRQTPGHDG